MLQPILTSINMTLLIFNLVYNIRNFKQQKEIRQQEEIRRAALYAALSEENKQRSRFILGDERI